MIKCYFIDVNSIRSDLPRSSFAESDLDQLADSILETDGLLRPLILQASGVEKYTVIEGHREYYAAVKAKEKDLNKAEMVNAFVIDSKIQQSAIDQLKLLTAQQVSPQLSNVIDPAIDRHKLAEPNSSSDLEKLLPTLLAAISQQVQPIVEQLAEHKQILDLLISDRQSTSNRQAPQQPESTDILPTPIPAVVKLATHIIANRDTQPMQKFDSWETIASMKIKGLTDLNIKKIIDNLR